MTGPADAEVESPKRRRREGPRAPSRGRGILRYGALLDATDELLREEDPDAIGLYQIAERAGIPAASIYHFFPTKEAAYVALAQRYLDGILEVHRTPIEARRLNSWQDLFLVDIRRAMDFYNAHPPMCKLIYGGYGGVEARNIDKLFALKLANANYDRLNRIFQMPPMGEPEKTFEIRLAILDAIWTVSVRRNNRITEDYLDQAYLACVAYTRLFLPERVERRDTLIQAAERDESIVLPFDPEPPARPIQ